MVKSYDNLEDLFSALEDDIEQVLKTDVANKAISVMKKHVKSDVYDKYDPNVYERKKDKGGLLDSVVSEDIDKNTISIENNRKNTSEEQAIGDGYEDSRDIANIVETGKGYYWVGRDKKGRTNETPRPFVANTSLDLDENGQHVNAMKNGLKKKGYEFD